MCDLGMPCGKPECSFSSNRVEQREKSARRMFEQSCRDGIRPMMYNLTRVAGGEYASCFTEWAWKLYWKGINDSEGAF